MANEQPTSLEQLDHVVVLEPAMPAIEELLRAIAKPTIQIHRVASADEAVTIAMEKIPCMVICNVSDPQAINPCVKMLKRVHKWIKKGTLKTMVLSKVKNPQLKQLITELGVTDYVMDPIPARTLLFKFNLQINAILAIKKREALLNNHQEIVFKKDGEKSTEQSQVKSIGATSFARRPALKLPEDTFALNGASPKKVGKKTTIEVEGPSPDSGIWQPFINSATPKFRWLPNDPDAPEQKDAQTGWVHEGDEPVYNSNTNRWALTGEKPSLCYLRNNVNQGAKIESVGSGGIEIADDSEHAQKRIADFKEKVALGSKISADIINTDQTHKVGGADKITETSEQKLADVSIHADHLAAKENQAKRLAEMHSRLAEEKLAAETAQKAKDAERLASASVDTLNVTPANLDPFEAELAKSLKQSSDTATSAEKTTDESGQNKSVDLSAPNLVAAARPEARPLDLTPADRKAQETRTAAEQKRDVMQRIQKLSTMAPRTELNDQERSELEKELGVQGQQLSPAELSKRDKIAKLQKLREELRSIELAKEALASEATADVLPTADATTQATIDKSTQPTAAAVKERISYFKSPSELDAAEGVWAPCAGHLAYLTPQHRGRSQDSIRDMMPIWIYSGAETPEFQTDKQQWRFFDVEPRLIKAVNDLPDNTKEFIRALKEAAKAWDQATAEIAPTQSPGNALNPAEASPAATSKPISPELEAMLEGLSAFEKNLCIQHPELLETLVKRKARSLTAAPVTEAINQKKSEPEIVAQIVASISEETVRAFLAGLQVMVSDAFVKRKTMPERAEKICALIAKSLRSCNATLLSPKPDEWQDLGVVVGSTRKDMVVGQTLPILPTANLQHKPLLLEGIYATNSRQLLGYLLLEYNGNRKFFADQEVEIVRSFALILAPYWEELPGQNVDRVAA